MNAEDEESTVLEEEEIRKRDEERTKTRATLLPTKLRKSSSLFSFKKESEFKVDTSITSDTSTIETFDSINFDKIDGKENALKLIVQSFPTEEVRGSDYFETIIKELSSLQLRVNSSENRVIDSKSVQTETEIESSNIAEFSMTDYIQNLRTEINNLTELYNNKESSLKKQYEDRIDELKKVYEEQLKFIREKSEDVNKKERTTVDTRIQNALDLQEYAFRTEFHQYKKELLVRLENFIESDIKQYVETVHKYKILYQNQFHKELDQNEESTLREIEIREQFFSWQGVLDYIKQLITMTSGNGRVHDKEIQVEPVALDKEIAIKEGKYVDQSVQATVEYEDFAQQTKMGVIPLRLLEKYSFAYGESDKENNNTNSQLQIPPQQNIPSNIRRYNSNNSKLNNKVGFKKFTNSTETQTESDWSTFAELMSFSKDLSNFAGKLKKEKPKINLASTIDRLSKVPLKKPKAEEKQEQDIATSLYRTDGNQYNDEFLMQVKSYPITERKPRVDTSIDQFKPKVSSYATTITKSKKENEEKEKEKEKLEITNSKDLLYDAASAEFENEVNSAIANMNSPRDASKSKETAVQAKRFELPKIKLDKVRKFQDEEKVNVTKTSPNTLPKDKRKINRVGTSIDDQMIPILSHLTSKSIDSPHYQSKFTMQKSAVTTTASLLNNTKLFPASPSEIMGNTTVPPKPTPPVSSSLNVPTPPTIDENTISNEMKRISMEVEHEKLTSYVKYMKETNKRKESIFKKQIEDLEERIQELQNKNIELSQQNSEVRHDQTQAIMKLSYDNLILIQKIEKLNRHVQDITKGAWKYDVDKKELVYSTFGDNPDLIQSLGQGYLDGSKTHREKEQPSYNSNNNTKPGWKTFRNYTKTTASNLGSIPPSSKRKTRPTGPVITNLPMI
ncbi:hypothetical protein ABK040_002351 [Willaertia magna]